MNLFTVSDLHLSLDTDKPMDIFKGWENHVERIERNWKKLVNDDDTVVIGGDLSWALTLQEAKPDFEFLNSLPGKKIIIKGNHDFWWSTATKINNFFKENNFDTLNILYNNCYSDGNIAVCGTRGWLYDAAGENELKVLNRECGRLETSITTALNCGLKPMVFLHYPPAYGEFISDALIDILKKYGIDSVYYGHIHGAGVLNTVSSCKGITLRITSCDIVNFTPIYICGCQTFKKIDKI